MADHNDSPSFEELVAEALDSLPPQIAGRMENVEVVIEPEPTRAMVEGLPRGQTLLGLYQGVPLTGRGRYDAVLPDKITIFQGPIERACRTPRQIREQVRRTVIHEIAHHFGIDDDRLHELGWS